MTDHINLKYLYFGAALDTMETATSAPLAGNLNIKGYRNNKQVASCSVAFKPTGLLVDMLKVDLSPKYPGFANVDIVTFDFIPAKSLLSFLTKDLAAVLIDNIGYDAFEKAS